MSLIFLQMKLNMWKKTPGRQVDNRIIDIIVISIQEVHNKSNSMPIY
jgi:hypothetical protein